MQAVALKVVQRESGEQARARAIIRFNGLMFYSLATASFLETAVPLHVNRLNLVLAAQPGARLWLERIWWPQRAEHGRRLREYVEATWPEFGWNAAYEEFYQAYRAHPSVENGRAGLALEALGHCVAEVQAAVFYRALARSADEPALHGLARKAASDHVAFFDYFRAIYDRYHRRERVGFAQSLRTLLAVCRSARDFDVRTAFEPLERHWNGPRTVPELAYGDYVQRMAQLIRHHAALGRIERLLFRPWLKLERAVPVAQPDRSVHAPRLSVLAPQSA